MRSQRFSLGTCAASLAVLLMGGGAVGMAAPAAGTATDARVVAAVKKSDKEALRRLIRLHADVNTPEADGTTALQWAAELDDAELVSILIKAGANVNAANRYGITPLYLACKNGNAQMVEALLNAGADVNATLPEGETVLMRAARTGNLAAVKMLLGRDAKVNAREAWHGETALMWAAAENHPDVVQALIDRGADIHARSDTGKFRQVPIVDSLPGVFRPAGNFTALMFAAREGQVECVRALLAAGANPNDSLPSSATDIFGGNPDRKATLPGGASVLTVAIMNARYDVAVLLVERGANPNADTVGWAPLHQLVWTRNPNRHFNLPPAQPTGKIGSLELAEALLAHGADPNARMTREPRDGFRNWMNRIGATPFILAAKAEDPALMRLLVKHGANPALVTKDHTTALMAAAGVGFWPAESPGTENDSLEAVKLALELGGDVNAINDGGYTAMHGAAVHGTNSVVKLLHEKGAGLEVKTVKEGWTPLTIADGVLIANTYKATPHTAAYLRQLMGQAKESGSPNGAGR